MDLHRPCALALRMPGQISILIQTCVPACLCLCFKRGLPWGAGRTAFGALIARAALSSVGRWGFEAV
jgi:hypothetical protein